jgi:hypothetical protein
MTDSSLATYDTADENAQDSLLKLGVGFFSSKVLLSAVELGVFTVLAEQSLDLATLTQRLGLHERGARDFLDALVALQVLGRESGRYFNIPAAAAFLDRNQAAYIGGLLEMANARLYGFWGSLTEALRTGLPQNEVKGGEDLFDAVYASPERLRVFLRSMTGVSLPAAKEIARQFPWSQYQTVIDIGAAQGAVPAELALAHPHLTGGGFDLPVVRPIFEEYMGSRGVSARMAFFSGDFFLTSLPRADVLVMGHILHDWNLEQKRLLLAKAYDALPRGGALIVYDAMIDDDRRHNVAGLMMSLNMLIETSGGFDYTCSDCVGWVREAGFGEARVASLSGGNSMVVGIK